jgi:hypothetical protein
MLQPVTLYRFCDKCKVNIDTKNLRENCINAKDSADFWRLVGCITVEREGKETLHFCSEEHKLTFVEDEHVRNLSGPSEK